MRPKRLLLIGALALIAWPAAGQTASKDDTVRTDSDPTRPVFLSVRPEFYRVDDGVEQRALIVRYDAKVAPSLRLGRGAPGVVLRFELPLSDADVRGSHDTGVGDAYGQFFVIPYATRTGLLWAVGSGFIAPTATSDLLGGGKFVVAPIVAPVWKKPHGMFFVKVQNFISVAGDADRADVNFLLLTPLFVHAVGRNWWVLLDSETKTKWTDGGRTGVKSGFQFGRLLGDNLGLWIKPEAWWGPNRDGQWNLKGGVVWYQRPGAR